jgi:hypothetical protein
LIFILEYTSNLIVYIDVSSIKAAIFLSD